MEHTYGHDHQDAGLQEAIDRMALRALADSYALHVDSRDVQAVAALFTEDGRLVSRLHADGAASPIIRQGRQEIAAALGAGLDRYLATTHVVGGQVVTVDEDTATGATVCLAHHMYESEEGRRMLVMAVRYTDIFARRPGGWGFVERQLHLDWREDRALEDRP